MSERDYRVRLIDLPPTVNAVTALDEDGFYNVYINARLPRELQRKAFRHELRHISLNHFSSNKSTAECEREANEEGD